MVALGVRISKAVCSERSNSSLNGDYKHWTSRGAASAEPKSLGGGFEGAPPSGARYFPTTIMAKEPGLILPRRSPGAGGSNSALGKKILCVFRSRPMVRALFLVGILSTTVNLSGESSWMTVKLPSPQDAKK